MRAWVEVPALKSGVDVTVLMDLDDYVALDGRRISIGSHGYAQVWERPHMLLLHRWIMGVKPGTRYKVIVDHIDRNVLDCRRSNLRVVTPTQSNLNRAVRTRELPLGVYPTASGRYAAKLTRGYRSHGFGTYSDPAEAAAAVAGGRSLLDRTDQQPIRCTRCGDEDGPFTEEQLCEPCARPMPLDGVA